MGKKVILPKSKLIHKRIPGDIEEFSYTIPKVKPGKPLYFQLEAYKGTIVSSPTEITVVAPETTP